MSDYYNYSTKNLEKKKGLKPCIGITLHVLMFIGSIPFLIVFYYGGLIIKAICVIIYIYQLLCSSPNESYRKFTESCGNDTYFDEYNFILEEKIDSKQSIICNSPHGIYAIGFSLTWLQSLGKCKELMNFNFAVSRLILYFPLSGIIAKWLGLKAIDNKTFKKLMEKGENIMFLPGGFECATIMKYNEDRVYLKNRYGFIKYALNYGYKVHPSYNFGENKSYWTINLFENFRLFLNKLKIPGCLVVGKYFILPFSNIKITTVVGKGLQFPKIENPTVEEIKKYHKIYVESLRELFEKYKEFGSSEHLNIL